MAQNRTHTDTHSSGLAGFIPFILLFIVIGTFFTWCCCVGAWLARLWYYDGQLHKKAKKYDIQPLYIRERLAAEQEKRVSQSHKVINSVRWSHDVTTMSLERIQQIDNAGLRRRILEDKRISRLPAFEQDDGGDGSGFPDMPIDMTAEEYNQHHFPKYHASFRDLGLDRLARDDWLTYHHAEQMAARDQILDDQGRRESCVCMQLGSAGEDACGELWLEVADHLAGKYKSRFWIQIEDGIKKLYDGVSGESYPLEEPFGWLTLDSIARLVREDFCLFVKSPFSAHYTL